jgi:hypothetical protein
LDGDNCKSKTFSTFTTTFAIATIVNKKVLHNIELQTKRVATQPTFEKFKPTNLQVLPSRPDYAKGFPFEFELGRRMVHELGSSTKGSRIPITQTSTPKFVEEVVAKVMKIDKTTKLFQTMAIMSLNMGNLTMEVNTLNNILVMGEKKKAMLQEGLDKEKKFQKGYKHNVEI